MSDFKSLFQKRSTAENERLTSETNQLVDSGAFSRNSGNSTQQSIKEMFASREKKMVIPTAFGQIPMGQDSGRAVSQVERLGINSGGLQVPRSFGSGPGPEAPENASGGAPSFRERINMMNTIPKTDPRLNRPGGLGHERLENKLMGAKEFNRIASIVIPPSGIGKSHVGLMKQQQDYNRMQEKQKLRQIREQQEERQRKEHSEKQAERYKKMNLQEERRKQEEEERQRREQAEAKRRAVEANSRKQALLRGEGRNERLAALERSDHMDIGGAIKDNQLHPDVVHYRKDFSYLIHEILLHRYLKREPASSINLVVPDAFSGAKEYTETFIPLFIRESKAQISQEVAQMAKFLFGRKVSNWKLEYSRHESGGLVVYDVEAAADDITLYTRDCLFLLSPSSDPDMSRLNDPNSNELVILGMTWEQNLKAKKQIVIAEEHDAAVKKFLRNSVSFYSWKMEKLTTGIREFLAIKNLEFDFMADLMFNPVSRLKSYEQKHDYADFRKFFYSIKDKYNESQFKSIQSICLIKQGAALLQGPPGTGKTHTLIGVVSGLYHYIKHNPNNCRRNILICAPSNYAVDEIVIRLMKQGVFDQDGKRVIPKILRLGVLDKIKNEDIRKVTAEYLAEKEVRAMRHITITKDGKPLASQKLLGELRSELDEVETRLQLLKIQEKSDSLEYNTLYDLRGKLVDQIITKKIKSKEDKALLDAAFEKVMGEAEIICCTLNSSGSERLDRFNHMIEAIIVDEAAQCTEPSNIIPLRFRANKLILIGDPKQLPATTFCDDNTRSKYNRSMFERFVDSGMQVEFLDTQYRMLPEIRKFPSDEFYGGKLADAPSNAARQFPSHLAFMKTNNHLFFNLKHGRESQRNHSYFNEAELQFCVDLVKSLVKSCKPITANTIGVITPYREQMQRLRELLEESVSNLVEVNTVDAFQGQEKEIIIFSCVRSKNIHGEPKGIGFLRDTRRLNVALTRAKYGLFITGNAEVLLSCPTWKNLLEDMQKQGKLKSLDSHDEGREVLRKIPSNFKVDGDHDLQMTAASRPPLNIDNSGWLGKRPPRHQRSHFEVNGVQYVDSSMDIEETLQSNTSYMIEESLATQKAGAAGKSITLLTSERTLSSKASTEVQSVKKPSHKSGTRKPLNSSVQEQSEEASSPGQRDSEPKMTLKDLFKVPKSTKTLDLSVDSKKAGNGAKGFSLEQLIAESDFDLVLAANGSKPQRGGQKDVKK